MTSRALVAVSTAALATLLMSGCTGNEGDDPTASSSGMTPGTTSESADEVVDTEEDIDIGGRSLHLRCWGEQVPGEPTVLLISGQGPTVAYWDLMATEFAADGHHLCGYDRAGVGASEVPPEDVRTTTDQVADLTALLDAVDLNEPLVVVAHSLGSLPAIGLAHQAPERVAGVVLIDPWAPRVTSAQLRALPSKKPHESAALTDERRFLTEFPTDPKQNSEHLLIAACDEEAIAQLDEPGPVFGDAPVVVLQSPFPPLGDGLPLSYHRAADAAIADGNKELAAESTHGTVIEVEDTGHDIHIDRPEVVIDAIRDVLAR